jgi:hypothetical protein
LSALHERSNTLRTAKYEQYSEPKAHSDFRSACGVVNAGEDIQATFLDDAFEAGNFANSQNFLFRVLWLVR